MTVGMVTGFKEDFGWDSDLMMKSTSTSDQNLNQNNILMSVFPVVSWLKSMVTVSLMGLISAEVLWKTTIHST